MPSAIFEILGRRRKVTTYSEYSLSGYNYCYGELYPKSGDISIYPWVIDCKGIHIDRKIKLFRWLCRFKDVHPNELYGAWTDEHILEEERCYFRNIPDDEFIESSTTFGLELLREEPELYEYYNVIGARIEYNTNKGDNVLIVGPSAGAEAELASSVDGCPYICTGHGEHAQMCESRLLHDSVPFDILEIEDLNTTNKIFHHIVLTPRVTNAADVAKRAYEMLGLYGYIYFHSSCIEVPEVLEKLGMIKRSQRRQAVVYFKAAGSIPEMMNVQQ
jgi:hypothetical protein